MDETEDEANDTGCLPESVSSPKADTEGHGGRKKERRRKRRNGSSTVYARKEFAESTGTNESKSGSDFPRNLSGLRNRHRTRSDSYLNGTHTRSEIRASENVGYIQEPRPAIVRDKYIHRQKNKSMFNDRANMSQFGNIQDKRTQKQSHDCEESFGLYTDNSTQFKEFHHTNSEAEDGERPKGKENVIFSDNGHTCKSKEDMDDNKRAVLSNGCNRSIKKKSNSETNIATLEKNKEEGNAGRKRNSRGRKRCSKGHISSMVTNSSAIYDKLPENGGSKDRINRSESHKNTWTGNDGHNTSQETAKLPKSRRHEFKTKVENREEITKFESDDMDENIVSAIKKKVKSLIEDTSQMCKVFTKQRVWLKKAMKISISDQELLINVIVLLEKALSLRFAQNVGYSLIIVIKDTSFFESAIVPFLSTFLAMELSDWSQHVPVLNKIIKIALFVFTRTPTSMYLMFGLLDTLQRISENLPLSDNCSNTLQKIQKGIGELQSLKESQVSKGMARSLTHRPFCAFVHENEDPPDNFRAISMYPQHGEIKAENPPFFRMNKEIGRYNDLDHYLDVQYRLLREDFICPLREGIRQYKQQLLVKKKKLQDLRLYYDVKIHQLVPGRDGIYHILEFNVSQLKHVEWAHSKRLLYGSFLCLSLDNFETMLFATVADRDPQKLRRGVVCVAFQTDFKEVMEKSHQTFVMVESIAFFEAYKHVLCGLQNVFRLPFEKHLVSCEKDVDPPMYLTRSGSQVYDLEPLLDRAMTISKLQQPRQQILGSEVDRGVRVLSLSEWPTADDMGFDQSQYKAIQTALTRRFSITQGPPGTGKTYIGLQIVRVLLHNRHVWDETSDALLGNSGSPMLIVCYTNHALDQFLEGISKFYTGDIVRVGGRSSNEALAKHHFDRFREKYRRDRLIPRGIRDDLSGTKYLVNLYMIKMQEKLKALEHAKNRMLTENELSIFMQNLYNSLMLGFDEILWSDIHMVEEVAQHGMDTWIIEEWLGCGVLLPVMDENIELHMNINTLDNYENDTANKIEDNVDFVTDDVYVDILDVADAIEADRMMMDGKDISKLPGKEMAHTSIRTGFLKQNKQLKIDESTNRIVQAERMQLQSSVWQITKLERRKRNEDLKRKILASSVMAQEQVDSILNVWELDYRDRWSLYNYWRLLYLTALEEDFVRQASVYEDHVKAYKEASRKEDEFVLQHAQVIGMTTTCAARYQPVLQKIGPRIIIVEEAAEVLESHIITTLSEHCQHLILIGDHEQLRPNPTTYTLAKDYKLDVSLFERMVNNGIQCDCLEEQHRMRPEISMLLRHIYPNLQDHVSVKQYEHIRGVGSDIFFIDHTQEEIDDTDQKSHLNKHEARYIVALCKYLMRQGYAPNQITVLTTYSGQLFCLRNMMPKSDFDGVKVTVVDNYQGEENDIVLLSLVRSNREGKIGFLKISNRICVALSRAKKGFYVIGNFSFLSRHSELWNNIVETLKQEKRFGKALSLYCQNHPNDGFEAADAHDFETFSPEGGCKKECNTRLNCGHVCIRLCHPDDRNHEKYKCQKPCVKLCERGHSCKKQCYQECKCMVQVDKKVPKCGHEQRIPCSVNPEVFKCQILVSHTFSICRHAVTVKCGEDTLSMKCPMPCEKRLKCGHVCQNKCGEMHTTNCIEDVDKILQCGHTVHIQCSMSTSEIKCKQTCTHQLNCDHTCQNICGEKHDHNRNCNQVVTKQVPGCGHTVQSRCNVPVSKLTCDKMITTKFGCGHTSRVRCGQTASQNCYFKIEKQFECGHISKVPCFEAETIQCQNKCNTLLLCGHRCSGDCTECFKGRLHKGCSVSNVEVLICGHVYTIFCSYSPPCQKICEQKCPHKACKKLCSEYCEPCREPCTRSCPHFKCTKICSEICDHPTCNQPCQKRLHCGHTCIGICGEPCPTLCRICHEERVTRRRFGKENNPKSMFVQLSDCEDVVEVTAMDRWMQRCVQQGELFEIIFPVCPCCRTIIKSSVRYQSELNKIHNAIREVKSHLRSPEERDQTVKNELTSKIEMLKSLFKTKSRVGLETQICETFAKSVQAFKEYITKQKCILIPQLELDIRDELRRLELMYKLITLSHEGLQNDAHQIRGLKENIESTRNKLLSGKRLWNNGIAVARCVENIDRLTKSSFFEEPLMLDNIILNIKKEWSRGTWIMCAAGHIVRKVELINGSCPCCVSSIRETAI